MSRFPLPADDRLEIMIRESFDSMPGPDMRRLEQLESRLARTTTQNKRPGVNTLPWWIILILMGGFATASWWVANRTFNDHGDEQAAMTDIPEQRAAVEQNNGGNSDPLPGESSPAGQSEEQKSPVIYTRENF